MPQGQVNDINHRQQNKDKTVWCTQKAMGMLFDCSADNIGLHQKNIFACGELKKDSVTYSWLCAGQKMHVEWHVLG